MTDEESLSSRLTECPECGGPALFTGQESRGVVEAITDSEADELRAELQSALDAARAAYDFMSTNASAALAELADAQRERDAILASFETLERAHDRQQSELARLREALTLEQDQELVIARRGDRYLVRRSCEAGDDEILLGRAEHESAETALCLLAESAMEGKTRAELAAWLPGRSASARDTLARLPVINDPVISEAMAALNEDGESMEEGDGC